MFAKNVTLALITIASTPIAVVMLFFILKLARKYTNLQQKEVGKLNAYMDESISGQKAVIVQGIQEDVIAGLLSKMSVFERPLSREECSQEFFSLL